MRHNRPSFPRVLIAALIAASILSAPASQSARADSIVHTVQPGENLFRIGLKYGVSWTAIMQANGLASTYIYAGQTLMIPAVGGSELAAPPPPAVDPPPMPATTYVVQRGDTLFNIALRHGLTTDDLAAANGLYNPSLIFAGQTLVIPGGAASGAPLPASGGKQIVVDISGQHLYAYQGETLVYSFVASTGEPGRETAPGTYSVMSKIPNAYGATWNIWMPNWLGIYWAGSLQNGIHALPIQANGWRLWEGYLGTPVSYGCVILGVKEAQLLYNWAEVGTPVVIRY